jgi:hypothetical protein
MNPLYAEVLGELAQSSALEKLAEQDERDLSICAQMEQAELCDQFFDRVQKCAHEHFPETVLPRKEAAVIEMARCMISLRDTHASTGVKLAASFDETAALVQKLAVATFVDQVLAEELEKTADEAIREVQRLGREYAVTLMRGLLA